MATIGPSWASESWVLTSWKNTSWRVISTVGAALWIKYKRKHLLAGVRQ